MQLISEHEQRRRDHSRPLWALLCFCLFNERFRGRPAMALRAMPGRGRAAHAPRPRRPACLPTDIELPARPVYEGHHPQLQLRWRRSSACPAQPGHDRDRPRREAHLAGPVFYRARVGRGEKPLISSLRTMAVGLEQRIGKRLVRQDENHYTPSGASCASTGSMSWPSCSTCCGAT
ncbi:MAG: hypothetical protein R3F43_29950 [bacterium]